jgi:hypothetical protein
LLPALAAPGLGGSGIAADAGPGSSSGSSSGGAMEAEDPACGGAPGSWRRRPKKQRNPATTPCFFHTRTDKGCVRGDKCKFVHGERPGVVRSIGGGGETGGAFEHFRQSPLELHADDADDGTSGSDSDTQEQLRSSSAPSAGVARPEASAAHDAPNRSDGGGDLVDESMEDALAPLVDAVVQLRFLPRQISFGRRGGSRSGFSKS